MLNGELDLGRRRIIWQILIGISMIGLTVAIHAIGCARWLGFVGRQHEKHKPRNPSVHLFWDLLSTGMVLIVLIILESFLWALLYTSLPSHVGLSTLREAIYFSMVTFTTLGYGDVVLAPEWQILGPMEAIAGVTVIGLTTALLFAVVQRGWQIIHKGAS